MPLPREVDSRVSEELAAFIAPLVDNPDVEAPLTLGFIRQRILAAAKAQGVEPRRFGDGESLAAEIEALIEEFGEDALALISSPSRQARTYPGSSRPCSI